MLLSAALLAAAAAAEGGGGLTDINLGLTVWTIVLFLLFAFVLTKFGWKPLLQAVEERENSVKDAVESAHKANAEAQALLEKHHQLVREAGRERDEVLKRAVKEAEQIKTDLLTKARAESEQVVRRAREQVEREKSLAIQELRAQVADLAVEAAAKIVTSSLTPEAQRKLVSDFVAQMPRVP